ncbi:hypothetical protein [Nocardia sp. NBC_01009]|uniref:ATP dependent DNA ligase n=1 Tax=Nocardia sp. NBC_01009 TaxID=2975996 RepID=UPI00386E9C48|nr:hypothetical protein OHA42_27550 [Nocardia sp. NBC_01009]
MAVNDSVTLSYIGNVDTGFTQAMLDEQQAKLQPLQHKTPTADADVSDAIWDDARHQHNMNRRRQPCPNRPRH